jgi:4-hydroxybenzoyl-CoA thioesterase
MAVKKPYVFRTQVRFSQTDPAGYVFYPRFFEMFQSAIEDWFSDGLEVKYADMFNHGMGLPTAHMECDFIRPSRLGDMLELSVVPEAVGRTSITVRFIGRVGGEECLRARQVLVFISTKDGRPVPIDDDMRARLGWYLPGGAASGEAPEGGQSAGGQSAGGQSEGEPSARKKGGDAA